MGLAKWILIAFNDKTRLLEVYEHLEKIASERKDFSTAYEYSKKYQHTFEEIYGKSQANKIYDLQQNLADNRNQSVINKLENENEIKEIKIKQQRTLTAISVLASLVLLSSIFLYIRKRNKEKEQNELIQKKDFENKLRQLELDSLRAQMNPHFIFNALNSIKSMISKGQARPATSYLNKFVKLLRSILENSKRPFITLEKELESLETYVEIEKIRFDKPFQLEINCPVHLKEYLV